ncbi:MAG: hypothetical protein O6918_14040, partial [Deltaproteobacteria bacterium]|nr:hypothetical protein [Deltaproteobacteria bacterium]
MLSPLSNPDPTKIIKPYAILPRSNAHQGKFLPFENLRAVSLSNRGLINVGSGLIDHTSTTRWQRYPSEDH